MTTTIERTLAADTAQTVVMEGDATAIRLLDAAPHVWRIRTDRLAATVRRVAVGSLWVASELRLLRDLLEANLPHAENQRLLVVGPTRPDDSDVALALRDWFTEVALVGNTAGQIRLPRGELQSVLVHPDREAFAIKLLKLSPRMVRVTAGDGRHFDIDMATLPRRKGGPVPTANRLQLEDFGRTLRFGGYEMSMDGLRWERDREYRVKANKRATAQDTSAGGALRRLRLQRRLGQEAFGLPARTIRRIEAGEVKRINTGTREQIERTLGMPWEEVVTY